MSPRAQPASNERVKSIRTFSQTELKITRWTECHAQQSQIQSKKFLNSPKRGMSQIDSIQPSTGSCLLIFPVGAFRFSTLSARCCWSSSSAQSFVSSARCVGCIQKRENETKRQQRSNWLLRVLSRFDCLLHNSSSLSAHLDCSLSQRLVLGVSEGCVRFALGSRSRVRISESIGSCRSLCADVEMQN